MTVQADRRRSIAVPEQLRVRLPGLEAALDVETAAAAIERELLGGGADTVIVSLSVGTIWVGEDTCTLRYRVRVRSPATDDGGSEQVVLGQVSSTGLALHLFPHDPALPTLPQALDRATARRTLAAAGLDLRNAQVTVVHHPRHGACVLRYDVDGSRLFAKVYGDDATGSSVAAVQSRLQNLTGSVRFPTVLTYDPSLRLLVMEAVPGVHLTQPAGAGAGHALAHLHGQDVAGAPTRTLAEDLTDLDWALTVIGRFRPGVADLLRQAISEAVADAADAPAGVLTHGDYTPSQLLWDGTAVGVVDLDDMCVADPARDLGRFIAAFALPALRQIGMSYASAQVSELTATLVEAYLEARPPGQPDHTLLRRVAVHRDLSLARSAARSCRQLKEDRLAAALTLLSVEADQATSADPA